VSEKFFHRFSEKTFSAESQIITNSQFRFFSFLDSRHSIVLTFADHAANTSLPHCPIPLISNQRCYGFRPLCRNFSAPVSLPRSTLVLFLTAKQCLESGSDRPFGSLPSFSSQPRGLLAPQIPLPPKTAASPQPSLVEGTVEFPSYEANLVLFTKTALCLILLTTHECKNGTSSEKENSYCGRSPRLP
jgi:hypothetical protein